jgi:hypothetical protein
VLPGEGRVLRKIWPLISMHTLVEFKSVSRPPRPGDLTRLYGYGSQYHAAQIHDVGDAKNLSLVLATACMTPTLEQEIRRMGWTLDGLGDGTHRMRGPTYPSFLVLLDDVAEAERDPLLGAFGRRMLDRTDRETWIWLIAQ